MLWVLKRTVSMMGKENIYNFTLKYFVYLNYDRLIYALSRHVSTCNYGFIIVLNAIESAIESENEISMTTILLILLTVQTVSVCKDCQQTTLAGKELLLSC